MQANNNDISVYLMLQMQHSTRGKKGGLILSRGLSV